MNSKRERINSIKFNNFNALLHSTEFTRLKNKVDGKTLKYIGIIFIITQFSIPKMRGKNWLEQKKNSKLIQMGFPRIIVRYFYQIS